MTKLRDDSGAVLVFITLMIVLLMIMVGMGLDTGFLTFSRSMGQRAVDMAALAGAAGLAKGDADAISNNIKQLMVDQKVNDYIDRSGNVIDPTVSGKNVTLMKYDFKTGTITGTTTTVSEANGVRVALETTNPYTGGSSKSAVNTPAFLTPLLNLLGTKTASGSNNVNVSAVAVIQAQPGLPIALNGCDSTKVGTNTPIPWNQAPSGGSNPNNSGWTTYFDNSVSSPDVIKLIDKIAACQGTGGANVGDNICTNNGSQTPDLREMEILIGPNPNEPLCYLAPIIPSTSNFTGCSNTITAFAQICPLAICGPGVNGSKNQSLCTEDSSFGKYVLAKVKSCSITDRNKAGISQCFSLRLVREPQVGM
jgi:Flp pilus assembly protein TadG